ncbi:MAG: 2-hydroxymuconate tautomerase [Acidimicrobiales bacterium]
MPIVRITLMEGRPPEKIEKMIVAVSEAIATSLEAPIESVRVMVHEMQTHQYGVGGKPWRAVKAEREAAPPVEEDSS